MKRYKRIVVIGSVGFDQIMQLPGKFSSWIMPDKINKLNVSFTVESLRREYGGTGGNLAYTLGLLGVKPKLLGILGRDGELYRKHLSASGVDVSAVILDPDQLSALGTVMTDEMQNQIWSYYPGPLVKMADYNLQKMLDQQYDFIALVPSEPASFATHLTKLVRLKAQFMFDPSFFIPNLSLKMLLLGIQHARIVIGNDYEIELMERKSKTTVSQWLDNGSTIVIRTVGEKGSVLYHRDQVIEVPSVQVKKVGDPSGAGDAFRGGFLAGYIAGKSIEECGRMGALAGAWCVENQGTQQHYFTKKQFTERLYG